MNDQFKTKDLGEAAVLLTKGFKLLTTEHNSNIVYFFFNNKPEAEKIVQQYNFGGIQVTARAFHDNLVLIKRKILAYYNPEKFKKDVRTYK